MTDRPRRNLARSVHDRLLKLAHSRPQPFDELLLNYVMERFLYRLGRSRHADRFALKGGLMLLVWHIPTPRHTMDVDLLGHLPADVPSVVDAMRDVCKQEVEEDGLFFDDASIMASVITKDMEHPGARVKLLAHLDTAKVTLRIDVGFGDVVVPGEEVADYPTLLDFPAPRVRTYTRESVVAEKLHAMVQKGETNSRGNDFFDLWLLSSQFAFDGSTLAEAVKQTFENRGRAFEAGAACFTATFGRDPIQQTRWMAFVRKQRLEEAPELFEEVVAAIAAFAVPLLEALQGGGLFGMQWPPGGPWSE